jgi:deoxyribose-phosphate aldolase
MGRHLGEELDELRFLSEPREQDGLRATTFSIGTFHNTHRTMKNTYEELAKMIDHSLLHPTMTDQDLDEGCRIAAKYKVASVCIKPYAVKRAAELLKDSGVLVGAVIGFPHGNSATESKRFETALACRDGAAEIDMVINIGKALGGHWDYVESDVKAVCDEAHAHGARVKVIFENDYLTKGGAGLGSDDFKRKLCTICERAGADWVKTSSGYGFVKQADGSYNYKGATEHDLALMRAAVSDKVQVKAAGGVRDLDGLIRVRIKNRIHRLGRILKVSSNGRGRSVATRYRAG